MTIAASFNRLSIDISYLYSEWRVLNNSAPPSIYDEYAELLIEGINALLSPNASLVNPNSPKVIATSNSKEESSSVDLSTDLTIYPYDADATVMLKIFRMKLQYFLQISVDYLPERILNLLPSGELRLLVKILINHPYLSLSTEYVCLTS